jgi:hypothetical protein
MFSSLLPSLFPLVIKISPLEILHIIFLMKTDVCLIEVHFIKITKKTIEKIGWKVKNYATMRIYLLFKLF